MNVTFFIPDIQSLATGGNVFNQKLHSQLASAFQVREMVIPEEDHHLNLPQNLPQNDFHDSALFLVDSLLINHRLFLKYLFDEFTDTPKILLLHYLRCIDPRYRGSDTAAREIESLQQFDAFIVTSQYSESELLRLGIAGNAIQIIQPGVPEIPRQMQAEHEQNRTPRLLTVSSIFPGKGLVEFITVLEQLSDLQWEWHLAGEDRLDPAYTRQFTQKLAKSRAKERIRYLGALPQDALLQHYREYDILVLPSRFETCSMVTMEAMTAGLPVLAFKTGGLAELVRQDENGWLVPDGNWLELQKGLRKLLLDKDLRRRFGARGAHFSSSFPSWQESGMRMSEFLTGFLTGTESA